MAVSSGASDALRSIGRVITNPELMVVVPDLLAALTDPNNSTKGAIQKLMVTSYIHPIDPASLSLIIPILHWGMRAKSADTKRQSVQIVGSACTLVRDDSDLLPYLPQLEPELKVLLLDAIPDTRLFASKAIGLLLNRLGEENFTELVPWLITQLETAKDQISRDGAALGLAEAMAVQGIHRLEAVLPELHTKLQHPTPQVREAFTGFIQHLPHKFPRDLAPHVPLVLGWVFEGMVDSAQNVRSRAGEVGIQLVQFFYNRAEDLLLETIEGALQNSRFRESAIQIMGFLLARMAGVWELQLEPDEMQAADQATNKVSAKDAKQISEVLGKERHFEILSMLQLYRYDSDRDVANMAGRVIRSLVENPGTMIDEIFDVLVKLTMKVLLSADKREEQYMGARCCGGLAQRNFDQLMPVLLQVQSTTTAEAAVSQQIGILIAFAEINQNGHASKLQSVYHKEVEALNMGLLHKEETIRKAAIQLLLVMRKAFSGDKVMEASVPSIVKAIESGDETSTAALWSLKALLDIKPDELDAKADKKK